MNKVRPLVGFSRRRVSDPETRPDPPRAPLRPLTRAAHPDLSDGIGQTHSQPKVCQHELHVQ